MWVAGGVSYMASREYAWLLAFGVLIPNWRVIGKKAGGEGGIRTPDTVARTPHFECGAFNHSATSPEGPRLLNLGARVF